MPILNISYCKAWNDHIIQCIQRNKMSFSYILYRADSRLAKLQSNAVSHWLGANLDSALLYHCCNAIPIPYTLDISRSFITRRYTQNNTYSYNDAMTSASLCIHKRHPISRPHGELWGVFCEIFQRNMTAIYRERTVSSTGFRHPCVDSDKRREIISGQFQCPPSH